ncbi:MDIS1-interacting receptor like kinase 1-like isoform X2 [Miscanthus floridulus]|uniref:MDIS1-interacting receptor like kinase 1-like isoform X2 n=1 Tax=Miscanthus floridulus TaxID=154761 RepID=UPI0034579336
MAMVERRYGPCASDGFFLLRLLLPFLFVFSFLDVPPATAATATTTTQSSPLNDTQKSIMNDIASLVNSESGNTRWNTAENLCNWKGISCINSSSSSVITSIALTNYGLSDSSIFAHLCRLDTLQSLDLSRNSFTNLSAQFFANSSCSMKEGLQSLNLSTNQLANSLSDLSHFPQLEVLDLSFNSFASRNLSADLGDFPKLRSFNASTNNLNGEVPTSMVGPLLELVLCGNQLSGSIPLGLFRYENLTLLDLSQNALTGVVPDKFMSLPKLETLLLSGNKLIGEIPASLSNVTTLARFAANQNNFTGPIASWITKHVRMLDLSYNNLNGTIPFDFLSHQWLQTVDLTNNMLNGAIPRNLSQSLYRLRLGGNKLGENIPESICDTMGMTYLELDGNQLTGNIPSEFGKCNSLSLLNLASNRLQGSVPSPIGELDKLVVLKLQNNSLIGPIPSTFSDLKILSTLNLSQNSLSGGIPSGIFELAKLSNLYLQGNNISGHIPISISSSKYLIELNLGDNALTGTIPTMPTTVTTSLLNLSHNHLNGPIPSNINSLSELEILDLSHNNLSGDVPSSLGTLQSLTLLELSYNDLSGSVPKFRQNQNVDIDIVGNPDLVNGTGNNNDTPTTGERIPAGEGVSQIINGTFISMNSTNTATLEYMKEKRDDWRITPFQALNFEVADIPQGLTEENLVGSGGSGHVYRVTYTNRYNSRTGVVAVKQIRSFGSLDEKLEREFESEARILCNIRHNNIIKLLCCLSSADSKLLVYDYMDNGSLDKWLHGNYVLRAGNSLAMAWPVQRVPLDWPTRLLVAVGAAQGLCYMHHECSPPIVHRDIKTSNILLDSEFRAKIADFGVSRMLVRAGEPNTMSAVAGSFGYMAPEYAYTRKVNEKVDVYSFGVVLLELTTSKKANDGGELGCLAEWAHHHYQSGASILNVIDKSIRYAGYPNEIETAFRLGVECTGILPSPRPTMKDVLQILLKCSERTLRKSRMECSMELEAAPFLLP